LELFFIWIIVSYIKKTMNCMLALGVPLQKGECVSKEHIQATEPVQMPDHLVAFDEKTVQEIAIELNGELSAIFSTNLKVLPVVKFPDQLL
jgi:hypothetical protein